MPNTPRSRMPQQGNRGISPRRVHGHVRHSAQVNTQTAFPLRRIVAVIGITALVVAALVAIFLIYSLMTSGIVAGQQRSIVIREDMPGIVEVAADEYNRCLEAGDLKAEHQLCSQYAGLGTRDAWSAAFVEYCGYQCGLDDVGIMPHSGEVAQFLEHYAADPDAGVVFANDGTFVPQEGDIAVWNGGGLAALGEQRLAVVLGFDAASGIVHTVEGDMNGGVARGSHKLDMVSRFVRPAYPDYMEAPLDKGDIVAVPVGLGDIDTFEGWSLITDTTSPEHALRVASGENYNDEGFGIVDGCYVVAVRPSFGSVGDFLTFTFADGSTIECIVGDIKGDDGEGVNQWGFLGGANILEFVVEKESWYSGHENPGTPACHPEWGQYIVNCKNTGNYWGL